MKNIFAAAVIAATTALVVTPAVGGMGYFYKTPELLAMCQGKGKGKPSDQIACMGYLAGVLDGSVMLRQKGSETEVCLPKGVNLRQIQQLFIKYAEDNPKIWHWPAQLVVQTAVADAFACRPLPEAKAKEDHGG